MTAQKNYSRRKWNFRDVALVTFVVLLLIATLGLLYGPLVIKSLRSLYAPALSPVIFSELPNFLFTRSLNIFRFYSSRDSRKSNRCKNRQAVIATLLLHEERRLVQSMAKFGTIGSAGRRLLGRQLETHLRQRHETDEGPTRSCNSSAWLGQSRSR